MVETLGKIETVKEETTVFNSDSIIRVECYSNEYADELRAEMNQRGIKTLVTKDPRLVIGLRET